ncbi:MAG: hypothetical protein GPOALKHO_001215 [Sodalis sp.]|nr:MAG: hypothetical protein GPOALKHO_001215 [Sodalis sp.]
MTPPMECASEKCPRWSASWTIRYYPLLEVVEVADVIGELQYVTAISHHSRTGTDHRSLRDIWYSFDAKFAFFSPAPKIRQFAIDEANCRSGVSHRALHTRHIVRQHLSATQ